MRRFCLLAIVIFLMAGCARVRIRQITNEYPYEEGLRFYRPHPYLWVAKDKDGALQSTIIWLPDWSQEYVIKVEGGIGSVTMSGNLDNGWNLTGFGETRDSKTPEMIAAFTGFFPGPDTKGTFLPGLYRFEFDKKTGFVTNLVRLPFNNSTSSSAMQQRQN